MHSWVGRNARAGLRLAGQRLGLRQRQVVASKLYAKRLVHVERTVRSDREPWLGPLALIAVVCAGVAADSAERPAHLKSAENHQDKNDGKKSRQLVIKGSESDLKKRYKLGEVLGEGTFAVVRVGVDRKSKVRVAVKEISKELSELEALENEVQIMEITGKHDNVVSLRDVFDSKDVLFLVMDLAEGGELFDRIIERGELSEQAASKMFLHAVKGVHHLHARNIAHLDIKPENLLLTSKNDDAGIKIADFGLAIDLSKFRTKKTTSQIAGDGKAVEETKEEQGATAKNTRDGNQGAQDGNDKHSSLTRVETKRMIEECVGTPAYWSPEMVKNEPFDEKADIWALGCVLYILLTGAHPFDPMGDATEAQILAQVAKGDYDRLSPQYLSLSPGSKDLIRHMLDPDPATRYTAEQLLRHPWLSEAGQLSVAPLSKDHITKLRGFRIIRLLRQGMQHMLGSASSDLFSVFDKDGDGFISRAELRDALELIGWRITKRELNTMMKTIDDNADGLLSREEFDVVLRAPLDSPHSSVRGARRTSIEDIEFLFRVFDRDRDGYIEHGDLMHVLGLLGANPTASVVANGIAMVDVDHDGRCDFAEFVSFWRMCEQQRNDSSPGFHSVSPVHIKHRRTNRGGMGGVSDGEKEGAEFAEMSSS